MMRRFKIFFALSLSLICCVSSALADDDSDFLDQAKTAIKAKNFAKAREIVEPFAKKGNAAAQAVMGDLCGVTGEAEQAAEWYRKGAEQGDAKAQNDLGMAYVRGAGVKQDDVEAFKWLKKAADQGHIKAANNMAVMYATGRGVARDEKESFNWSLKAAEKGDAAAQSNLGIKYRAGRGVDKNNTEALKWFLKASAQNYPYALYAAGEMYESGTGTKEDRPLALKLYQQAAALGFPQAEQKLELLSNEDSASDQTRLVIKYGEKIAMQYEVKDLKLTEPTKIAFPSETRTLSPGKPQTLNFSLALDENTKMTMLFIKNNFDRELLYDCSIKTSDSTGFASTSVLPVRPGMASYEGWPYAIDSVMLHNLRLGGNH